MGKKEAGRRAFLKTATAAGVALGGLALAEGRAVNAAGIVRVAGKIPRKQLGTTGATVPIMQLGTSQRLDPTYDRVMHGCFKEGVDAFDTALAYGWGRSHRDVANFISQMGDRRKLWLTSKSGREDVKGFMRDIDNALKELRTDYLDLYLMHGIEDLEMLDRKFLVAGEKLKKSGKTRFFGFSCHDGTVVELMKRAAQIGSGAIDAILFRYNFRRYGDLELNRAIDACKKAGIGLVAMKTNGSVPRNAEKVVAFRSKRFTLDQAKLKSVWADERIDSLLSEIDSIQVLRENVAAAKSEASLSAGEWHQLNRLAALTAHLSCNGCAQYCEQAAGGQVPIADALRFLMYHECYGDPERARALYEAMPRKLGAFEHADLAAASAACPQGIDIAARLHAARAALEA